MRPDRGGPRNGFALPLITDCNRPMLSLRAAAVATVLSVFVLAPRGVAVEAPRPWAPNPFAPITLERIADLPDGEQPAWRTYWTVSQILAARLPARPPAPETVSLQPLTGAPKGGKHTVGLRLDAPAAWYASDEARTIADRVVAWQSRVGAWKKGINYMQPRPAGDAESGVWSGGTFDNDATIYELRFLALVASAGGGAPHAAAWRAAFVRGLRYVFAAQNPAGGFPQVFPLAGGYHDAVTFNDDAMAHALELLRDVAAGKAEFAFVSAELRAEAEPRLARGVRCVLATQLKGPDGRPTVWCQQYDALTLQPCAARNFEPIADVSQESAMLTEFLMSLPKPSPEIVAAVDGAIAWFQRTTLHDVTWIREPAKSRGEILASPGAPPLWSRYYEPGTTKPIFGDRDRTIHYAVAELSAERRAGYSWYGTWPATALAAYPAWRRNI
jgi:PelA/Pel-15E family pectate lyase